MNSSPDYRFALVGNPNVGKSTLFNALTRGAKKQHTGNWAGKTVSCAQGDVSFHGKRVLLADLPGTCSLHDRSPEEREAVEYLRQYPPDAVLCVADARALNRGIALCLQILERDNRAVLCINLMDEAKKRGIRIDAEKLSFLLGIPVVCTEARGKKGLSALISAAMQVSDTPPDSVLRPTYPKEIDAAVSALLPHIQNSRPRLTALTLLQESPDTLPAPVCDIVKKQLSHTPDLAARIEAVPMQTANRICAQTVARAPLPDKDRLLDRVFTGKLSGTLTMLFFLFVILWLTVSGANVVSDGLFALFAKFRIPVERFTALLPDWADSLLSDGVYTVLAWVVSVMLPPLMIFFPLFTFLEEFGYLPRLAYQLDPAFCKAGVCGKQALTVCMGFGCNAVGVTGCRIIDAGREQDIAMLTNSFTPCNGRIPLLMTLFTLFFCSKGGWLFGMGAALGLCVVLMFSLFMTFFSSWLLSKTLFRGENGSFTLELPSYRRPNAVKILTQSLFDKTLHVLARAVVSAVCAGVVLWLAASVSIGGMPLLHHITRVLNPVGRFFGLDGSILAAFLLGLPANEIVLPILLMIYTRGSTLLPEPAGLYSILAANGWTQVTAVCTMLFTLMH